MNCGVRICFGGLVAPPVARWLPQHPCIAARKYLNWARSRLIERIEANFGNGEKEEEEEEETGNTALPNCSYSPILLKNELNQPPLIDVATFNLIAPEAELFF